MLDNLLSVRGGECFIKINVDDIKILKMIRLVNDYGNNVETINIFEILITDQC